jgi:hypothetical protein
MPSARRATLLGMTERRDRWREWIDGKIRKNVLDMHLQRDSYMKVTRILAANDRLPESYWWEFMVSTYITTQVMAVRRQADNSRRVASLARIMLEIKSRPEAISRDYWLGQWDLEDEATDPYGGLALVAENAWAEQYAGGVGDYVDPAIPEADYAKLRSAASKVNQFANRHIAHSQATIHQPDLQRPPDVEPASAEDETLSAKEVHEVIDVIGDLFKKYYNLLTASSYVFLEPVIQHDWLAPFRVPWMEPGYEPED